jgi:hypothetical protein
MTRRHLAAAVLALAGALASPVALAGPAAAAMPCEWSDAATNPWNYPLDGVACVVLDTSAGIRLVGVTNVQPGWSYKVNSWGGGTKGVDIRFSNAITDERVDFRYAPGKTRIG